METLFAGGGYVISPVNQGEQSVVRHMLSIDWKYWKPYRQASSAQSISIRMLGRLAGVCSFICYNVQRMHLYFRFANMHSISFCILKLSFHLFVLIALREWFSSKSGGCSSSDSTLRELMTDSRLHPSEKAENAEAQKKEENEETVYDAIGTPAFHSCHLGLDDDADEFFHASEYDQLEICCPSAFGPEIYSQVLKLSLSAIVKGEKNTGLIVHVCKTSIDNKISVRGSSGRCQMGEMPIRQGLQ